jgi:enoyl-CoA hydratase/carnithine racemase
VTRSTPGRQHKAERPADPGTRTAAHAGTLPRLEIAGARATIHLNRPGHHNRIEAPDIDHLLEIFDRLEADHSVRVLVLTGTGRSFSAGYDLSALQRGPGGGELVFASLVDRLERLAVPTICALNGGVYGGGTDLALACDFRIGARGMELRMPASQLGVHYYHGGLRRFVARLGLDTAKRLFLLAETISAEELLRIGYLTELVDADRLLARAGELADLVASRAPIAVRGMKRALNELADGTDDAAAVDAAYAASFHSEEVAEGLRAWAERRTPRFGGH